MIINLLLSLALFLIVPVIYSSDEPARSPQTFNIPSPVSTPELTEEEIALRSAQKEGEHKRRLLDLYLQTPERIHNYLALLQELTPTNETQRDALIARRYELEQNLLQVNHSNAEYYRLLWAPELKAIYQLLSLTEESTALSPLDNNIKEQYEILTAFGIMNVPRPEGYIYTGAYNSDYTNRNLERYRRNLHILSTTKTDNCLIDHVRTLQKKQYNFASIALIN
jgi:hypothetical protein